MNRTETLKILDLLLVGNDANVGNTIISFLEEKCFICNKDHIKDELVRAYCDKPYKELYMDICIDCKNKFSFMKCYQCRFYADITQCYTMSSGEYYCCKFCVHC